MISKSKKQPNKFGARTSSSTTPSYSYLDMISGKAQPKGSKYPMNVKLISSKKDEGKLVSITLQIIDANEIKAFRKLYHDQSEIGNCSECGDTFDNSDKYHITILSPLSAQFGGLELATPSVICDKCGHEEFLSMVDFTAFPNAMGFVKALRDKYAAARKEKANG